MIHYYDLDNEPFLAIKNNKKDIEMRLNDEKRQLISIGDLIEFRNNITDEKILVKVLNLHHFKNFNDLYNTFPKSRLGYLENDIADYKDMYKYYSQERINQYGVLGIEIKKLED